MDSMLLPPELFGKIVSFLEDDMHALCCCASVNRAFHSAATPLLYKRIHISPPEVGLAWQVVEDTLGRRPFSASRLPSHCAYVEEFTLDGYLTNPGPPKRRPMPIVYQIPETMRLWRNLKVVTLTPQKSTVHVEPALMKMVDSLRHCPSLRAITVNEYVMEDDMVPHLAEIVGLQDLTLINPTRAVFLVLRDWLKNNEDSLVGMKLIGNCGSLTPGLLRMIITYISKVRTLAIGLSYSLANADIFTCLSQLPKLQNLRLRYYPQHGALPPAPILPELQRLTVLHTTLSSKQDAVAFSAWLRRVTTASRLESLETISIGPPGPKLCFDGFITHMANRHSAELRELRMSTAHVRRPALQLFLTKCSALQHVSLTIAFSTLQALPTMTSGLGCLRTVSFDVSDRPRLVLEKKDAQKIMERVPNLRCITIKNVTWKGTWIAEKDEDGNVKPEFVVGLISNLARNRPLDDTSL